MWAGDDRLAGPFDVLVQDADEYGGLVAGGARGWRRQRLVQLRQFNVVETKRRKACAIGLLPMKKDCDFMR